MKKRVVFCLSLLMSLCACSKGGVADISGLSLSEKLSVICDYYYEAFLNGLSRHQHREDNALVLMASPA